MDGAGGAGRGISFMISRSDGADRDWTRSRARARTSSATGGCWTGASRGGERALCRARMAFSKVKPCASRISAAMLLASPTIAASTMAPLISRRRLPRDAAAAASKMRFTSGETPRDSCGTIGCWAPWRTREITSPLMRSPSIWLASSTATASGSSQRAASKCSSETSDAPVAPANSAPRDSVVASSDDMGICAISGAVTPTTSPETKAKTGKTGQDSTGSVSKTHADGKVIAMTRRLAGREWLSSPGARICLRQESSLVTKSGKSIEAVHREAIRPRQGDRLPAGAMHFGHRGSA
jgi:hypothetical protein